MRTPTLRYLDLSHPIEDGMAVAPGLPSPRIEPYLSHAASRARYAGQAAFEITRLFLVGNTGTSLDSPFHRFADGTDVAAVGLERLAGVPGLRLDAVAVTGGAERAVSAAPGTVEPDALRGRAVLLRTGWDRHWGTAGYWRASPFLVTALVDRLVRAGPALVGVDLPNVDDTDDPSRPAHTRLLRAGIPILESLHGLDRLPASGFRLFALPLAVAGAAAVPVRVVAEVVEVRRGG
jgi:arylformamidase